MTRTDSGLPRNVWPGRRPELDALRTAVVVGLVFFHAALVFDTRDDFYVKNAETTDVVTVLAGFGVVWAMPMLFLAAGLGSWHSLRRRGSGRFAVERLRRLGVPLVFATLTIIPVPQWLRQRADPAYDESYVRFLSHFFDVSLDLSEFPFVVQGRYFETGHLWFVVLLLAFSLVLAPLDQVSRRLHHDHRRRIRAWLARGVRWRGMILLPAVLLAVISASLGLEEAFAGWNRWAYLVFFLCGFGLAADDRFRAAMCRDAVPAAGLGLVLFFGAGIGLLIAGNAGPDADAFTDMTASAIAARSLYGAAGWCWLVAILGLLDRRRRTSARESGISGAHEGRGRRLYAYLAAAVLPLYVLHQPIVVGVAYGVVGWDAPIVVEYVVIVAASLVLTVGVYDLVVRRTRVGRFLFGMREPVASPLGE